ncbi:MAG: 3-keto-5-aminohexanoate cleavage protein [Bacteriovoracaceae bacterium]
MEKLIITCAMTGAETQKSVQPNLPITASEQIEAAHACYEAGAMVVHLHVRDDEGKPSQKLEHFERVISGIKKVCPIIIQISTGGAVGTTIEERLAPLSLKPHMASLNMGSINFGDEVFENKPMDIEAFAKKMLELEIVPEMEVYDLAMMEYSYKLMKKNIVQAPFHFQFVLGTPQGLTGSIENVATLKNRLPENSTWGIAGIGRFEIPAIMTAMAWGGHVRVGFEDNIYWSKGVLAKSNAELVKRVKDFAKIAMRDVANIDEAKALLKIHQ